MACTGTGTTINFKNNCVICLLPEDPNKMLEILRTNPKNLRTFQPVVHYLTGTDPTYGKSQEECKAKDLPVMTNLPPMCSRCYDLTSDIYRMHAELLELQVNIQKKTEEARRIVSFTRTFCRVGVRKSGRTLFLDRLLFSGMSKGQVDGMKNFVEKFHERIYAQGCEQVIFPSKPPPNYLPLPKLPPQPPIVLLQLPPSSSPQLASRIDLKSLTTSAAASSAVLTPITSSSTVVNGIQIGSLVKVAGRKIAPAPPPPLQAQAVPSPAPSAQRVQASTGGITPTSGSVFLVPGSQVDVKYENEAEDDDDEDRVKIKQELDVADDDTEENENLLQDPDGIIKEEVDEQDVFVPDDGDPSSDWEANEEEDDEEEEEIVPKKRTRKQNDPLTRRIIAHSLRPSSSHNLQLILPSVQQLPQTSVLASKVQPQQPSQPVLLPMPIQIAPRVILASPASLAAAQNISTSFATTTPEQNTAIHVGVQPNQTSDNQINLTITKRTPAKMFCDLCNESIPTTKMPTHLRLIHNGIVGHSCLSCKRTFISNSRLVMHWETRVCGRESRMVDLRQDFLTCFTCPSPQVKYNLNHISTHIFSSHETDQSLPKCHDCPICPLKFRTKHGLDFHINVHMHSKRITTNTSAHRTICPPQPNLRKKFIGDKELREYLVKGPCDVCQVSFLHTYLEAHLNNQHDIPSLDLLKCSLCAFHCTKLESLLEHLKNNHKELKEKPCHLCEEKFEKIDQLTAHLYELHGLGEKKACEFCNVPFYDDGSLRLHIENCHKEASKTNDRPHKCPHCDQAFRQKGALNYHVRHHKKKNTNSKLFGSILRKRK